jgi:hypothetical protein
MRYVCCDERRRETVRELDMDLDLNGIDFLEVVDTEAAAPAERQRVLRVYFLREPSTALEKAITTSTIQIRGGTRVTGIAVAAAPVWEDDPLLARKRLTVHVTQPGDYSTYTLAFVTTGGDPLPGLDPALASIDFSFKIECPSEFDCRDECTCQPEIADAPEIDYLARDYASFRRLMLDRLAAIVPAWQERNPADLGMALVEVLAYTADHLSYQLDAVGMESTLATARRRASATRHARMVDYRVSHGANARAWVQIRVSGDTTIPAGTKLLTRAPGIASATIDPDSLDYPRALASGAIVFETMDAADLCEDHNDICFYTWGDRECCLPIGATSATLRGKLANAAAASAEEEPETPCETDPPQALRLAVGDVLIFREQIGPRTGSPADADPNHRHAVRLTAVEAGCDPLGTRFGENPGTGPGVAVVQITWEATDALPFPLCLSATVDGVFVANVSTALGNIVAADHGLTIDAAEDLPDVPAPDARLTLAPAGASCACAEAAIIPAPSRYRPSLAQGPLTIGAATRCEEFRDRENRVRHRPRFFKPGKRGPAAALFGERRRELPAICITDTTTGRGWAPRRDLLGSTAFSREFVVEPEADGRAWLRFGDDEYGMRPADRDDLVAVYRVGNGAAGNIGAGALHHVVIDAAPVTAVTNPMPARGGTDPESIEHVRQIAPSAFRTPRRAVTAPDYATVAGRHPEVQQATATERWTGSWHTIFLTVDRRGGRPVNAAFETELRAFLERFRMAGHDLEIDGPHFVPLEIELRVCVLPDYFRGDVKQALLALFTRGVRPDGQPGVFHPDQFSFGQPVYLSRIIAAAQETPGVRFVEALVFQRQGDPQSNALDSGILPLGRLEIARLDNDPSFPERGVLRLTMEGGQ